MAFASVAWTAQLEADFIEEVRKVPQVWNQTMAEYSKRTLKRQYYAEIQKILSAKWPLYISLFDPDALMRKFGNLKTYYARERKRSKTLFSEVSGITFQPKWIHYKRLSFLGDDVAPDDSLSNSDETLDESEKELQTPEEQEIEDCKPLLINLPVLPTPSAPLILPAPSAPLICQQLPQAVLCPSIVEVKSVQDVKPMADDSEDRAAKKPKIQTFIEETNKVLAPPPPPMYIQATSIPGNFITSDLPTKQFQHFPGSQNSQKEDAEDAFGKFIADYMRKIPERKREQARLYILQYLYEVRFGD